LATRSTSSDERYKIFFMSVSSSSLYFNNFLSAGKKIRRSTHATSETTIRLYQNGQEYIARSYLDGLFSKPCSFLQDF
jgi:hypothetical protein